MSSYSEWQLMCLAEDIEPGDSLTIEHLKNKGKRLTVVYTGDSEDDLWVNCQQPGGKQFTFSAESLDEKGKRAKQWRITGKSSVNLRLRTA